MRLLFHIAPKLPVGLTLLCIPTFAAVIYSVKLLKSDGVIFCKPRR